MRTPVLPSAVPVKANGDAAALKFDAEGKKTFLAALRRGFPLEQAAGIAGVSRQTLWRHRRKDAAFNEDIEQARSMFALQTIQKMDEIATKAGDGLAIEHWKWRLEKALPESYGRQTAYNQQIGTQNNLVVVPELPSLDEIIGKITAARTEALARQIESEKKYDVVDGTVISETVMDESPSEP